MLNFKKKEQMNLMIFSPNSTKAFNSSSGDGNRARWFPNSTRGTVADTTSVKHSKSQLNDTNQGNQQSKQEYLKSLVKQPVDSNKIVTRGKNSSQDTPEKERNSINTIANKTAGASYLLGNMAINRDTLLNRESYKEIDKTDVIAKMRSKNRSSLSISNKENYISERVREPGVQIWENEKRASKTPNMEHNERKPSAKTTIEKDQGIQALINKINLFTEGEREDKNSKDNEKMNQSLLAKESFYMGRTDFRKEADRKQSALSKTREESRSKDKKRVVQNISTERSHADLANNFSFPNSNNESSELLYLREENKNLKNVIENLKNFPREVLPIHKLSFKDTDPITEETVKKLLKENDSPEVIKFLLKRFELYEFKIKEYETEISHLEGKKDHEMTSLRIAYTKMEEVLSKYKKKRMEDQLTIHQLTQELHGRKSRLQVCASNDCLIENIKRKSSPGTH